MTRRDPIHRGEVLRHDFMDPFGLSATALTTTLGVTPARISEMVRGRGESRRTRRYVWGGILALMRGAG